MPKLSIIVPIFRTEQYLHRCIDSIIAQTFTDFELILIDDGSPDGCGLICEEYAAKDSRVVVIHKQNAGVSAARNAGLDIVNGEYIGFVDSDDWIEPEMYKEMVNEIESSEVDVTICGINYYSENGTYIRTDLSFGKKYNRNQLLEALYGMPNPIGGGVVNKLFREQNTSNVRFHTNLSMAEDWVFLFECFKNCRSSTQVGLAYYDVRERQGSATRRDEAKAYYEIIYGGKLLLLLARDYSLELEKNATEKYMDDCLRYSKIIKNIGIEKSTPWRWLYFKIRMKIMILMPRAIVKGVLPRATIHRMLSELVMDK